jgi:putative glutamine amidotransferase
VTRAGGRAVLLSPAAQAVSETLAVAGLILGGGPRSRPRRLRALECDVPLLGICRGMQVLNVARGGTLHQHLPDVVGHDGHATAPGRFDVHPVRVAPGTHTGSILGARATVRSGHHQGLDLLGNGLIASAWSFDGAVEAIEAPGRRFALGVLWHPEQGDDGRLFHALVAGASPPKLRPAPGPS